MTSGWAGALAPTYAPELNIVGIAQGCVPANLSELANGLGTAPHPLFGLGFAATLGLEREYPSNIPLASGLTDAGLALRDRIANACSQEIIDARAYPARSDGSTGGSSVAPHQATADDHFRMAGHRRTVAGSQRIAHDGVRSCRRVWIRGSPTHDPPLIASARCTSDGRCR